MLKTCTICNDEKDESEFNFKCKSKGIRSSACKECTRKQTKRHYQNNKQYYLQRNDKRNSLLIDQIIGYLQEHPCVDCGESDPVVLEFDHVRNKEETVCQLVANGYGWDRIQKEINKCEIRCCNCHRRKTAKQLNFVRFKKLMP